MQESHRQRGSERGLSYSRFCASTLHFATVISAMLRSGGGDLIVVGESFSLSAFSAAARAASVNIYDDTGIVYQPMIPSYSPTFLNKLICVFYISNQNGVFAQSDVDPDGESICPYNNLTSGTDIWVIE